MSFPNLKDALYGDILQQVEKPSRYLGTELNSTHKDPSKVDVRLNLVFPDMYDLGLGNVGVLIMYALLNQRDWCWCERAYAPAPDMEAALRERGLPMFASESKDSLLAFDGIGFTLQSELNYTNILNIIDMAPMPLRWKDRGDEHPILFAGGPSVYNPEPLAPFLDFFVMGEGEAVIIEIAEVFRAMKGRSRREKLKAFAQLEGVYVPEFYPFETLADGSILPALDGPKIRKRLVDDLDGSFFPTNYIVPFTQQVHDRIGLEVLRGCTQGCRFCQPGMVTRPVRERSLKNIDELMQKTLEQTGYEEVSLLSLSTCDYSRPKQLVDMAARRAHADNVSVSLPSLRLDSFSVDLADRVAGPRRTGLTFAPEAASPRLRAVINKWIPDEELLTMSYEAYQRGWNHVKCYFMIGLPTERDEDIEAIVDLCERVVKLGKLVNPKASVNLGVSTFVPKPFTPFQWAEQISPEETLRRQDILHDAFRRNPNIKFGKHDPWITWIEGILGRTDRRAADVLEAAWRNGARHESWGEYLNLEAWKKAIEETGFDVEHAFRQRDLEERLPWDHIDLLLDAEWFKEDWRNAMELQHAPDCRAGKCHMCGVINKEREVCVSMLKRQKAGRIEEQNFEYTVDEPFTEPEPAQRLRFRIGRAGEAVWLSHLELMNAWIRSLRRARAPLSYSQGFHAHPKITFASAPPVGEESNGDYMDIVLRERVDAGELLTRLKGAVPDGFRVFDATEVPLKAASLMSSVAGYSYTLYASADEHTVRDRIAQMLGAPEILVERRAKGKNKKGKRRMSETMVDIDVRPMIQSLEIREAGEHQVVIDAEVTTLDNNRGIRTRELVALLGLDPGSTRILKRATHLHEEEVVAGV